MSTRLQEYSSPIEIPGARPEHMTDKEIGRALGISHQAVNQAKQRAKKRIREGLLDLLETDKEFDDVWGHVIRRIMR